VSDKRIARYASLVTNPSVVDMTKPIEPLGTDQGVQLMETALDNRHPPSVVGIYQGSAYLWEGIPPMLAIKHAKFLGPIEKVADIFSETAPDPEETPDYDFVYARNTLNIEPHNPEEMRHSRMLEEMIGDLFGDQGKGNLLFHFDDTDIVSGHVTNGRIYTVGFVDPEVFPHAEEAIRAYFRSKSDDTSATRDA